MAPRQSLNRSRRTPPKGALDPQLPPENNEDEGFVEKKTSIAVKDCIERISNYIRDLWINAYRNFQIRQGKPPTYMTSVRWDGGYDSRTNRRYKSIWPQIAYFVLKNSVEPEALVKAQFEYASAILPTPQTMVSSAGLAKYRRYSQNVVPKLHRQFQSEKLAATIALRTAGFIHDSPERAYFAVLCDLSIQLSALFRYCLGHEQGLSEVATYWKSEALEQYIAEPDCYDQVWGEFIPNEFRNEASKVKQLLNKLKLEDIWNEY